MDGDRTLLVLRDPDQWARCHHDATGLAPGGGVELAWDVESGAASDEPTDPAGLAFDRWCRGYRSLPRLGVVAVRRQSREGEEPAAPGLLSDPRGVAVDRAQRLYVAETGARAVHVVDLWGQRLLRRVPTATPTHPRRRPLDVVARDCEALLLTDRPAGLLRLPGRRGPLPGPVLRRPACSGADRAARLTALGDRVLVLWLARAGRHDVVATPGGQVALRVAHATDLELVGPDLLVVARRPGEPFLAFRHGPTGWHEEPPVSAPAYDGGAIAIAPDGRLACTTTHDWAWTAGSAARYRPRGRLVSYRIDSGSYRTRWGRVLLDGCVPRGTTVRAGFLTSDDDTVADPVSARPPARGPGPAFLAATPPLPSERALAAVEATTELFRSDPRPTPVGGLPLDDDARFDAPVTAPAGRYLWVVLELTGTARATPRVWTLRVEAPGHRLAHQLPALWSREEPDADFLQRFLAPAEGMLHELDERAGLRAVLLDPESTSAEGLGWLAGFVGIALDRRWPLSARRRLVAEAFTLFRLRGTLGGLERLLEICLGRRVPIIESWRIRGLGGAVLGPPSGGPAPPAVAEGTGTTSRLGRFTVGGLTPGKDGYTATAHRFTVLVPRPLSEDERPALATLVETHKPAHTLAEVCELDGMRIGRTSRIDLTTVVGPPSGWGATVVGQVLVGADGVVGLPAVGSRVEHDTREDLVRVG